jgi:DNA-binding GntR family transcriptional regulator
MTANTPRLVPVQPRTMVEQAAEAIVAAAARGAFLPGDRLVEAEIARDLGISRVPVREALRLLESQGIVVSTPYKGMRLMQISSRSVAELTRVRLALETLALREILAAPDLPARVQALRQATERHRLAAETTDPAEVAAAECGFHGELCRVSGNETLHGLWQSLARQLAVVWGLGFDPTDRARLAGDHARLLESLAAGDAAGAEAAVAQHVRWHEGLDFEALIAARRQARGAR